MGNNPQSNWKTVAMVTGKGKKTMNIKSTMLACIISIAPVSTLWAEGHFTYGNYLEPGSVLDFGVISTDEPATLEVYELIAGEMRDMLGSVPLNAGANADVRVNVGMTPRNDVLALIKAEDGHVLDAQHFHVHD